VTVCALALAAFALPAFALPAWAVCDKTQPTRTPSSRYVINGNQVYDRKTELTWQRCSVGQQARGAACAGAVKQITWDEAKAAEKTGWRLPTKDELATLISPTCKDPAMNAEAFPNLDKDKLWYWTSTVNGDFLAWLVNFADGSSTSFDRTDIGAVRLVRAPAAEKRLSQQEAAKR
jgi:hypothetical protein